MRTDVNGVNNSISNDKLEQVREDIDKLQQKINERTRDNLSKIDKVADDVTVLQSEVKNLNQKVQ